MVSLSLGTKRCTCTDYSRHSVEAAITLRASEAADTGRTEEDIKFTLADLRVDVAAFDGGPDDLRATLSTMDMRVLHGTNDVRATPPQTIIARTLPRNPVRSADTRTARRAADMCWRYRPDGRRQ